MRIVANDLPPDSSSKNPPRCQSAKPGAPPLHRQSVGLERPTNRLAPDLPLGPAEIARRAGASDNLSQAGFAEPTANPSFSEPMR